MEALDQLLMACHCQSINLFVESFLKMVAKLLESEKPNLQILGTNSVSSSAGGEAAAPCCPSPRPLRPCTGPGQKTPPGQGRVHVGEGLGCPPRARPAVREVSEPPAALPTCRLRRSLPAISAAVPPGSRIPLF